MISYHSPPTKASTSFMPKIYSVFTAILASFIFAAGYLLWERSGAIGELHQLARDHSIHTPRMISDTIRLDQIEADYPALVFYYTYFTKSSLIDADVIKAGEVQWLKDNACEGSDGYSLLLEKGFVIKRHYKDINDEHIALIEFSANDCKPAT